MTQINLRTGCKCQGAIAGAEFNIGPVRAVDNLAVTIHAQHSAVRIEYSIAAYRHTVLAGQTYIADPLTTGIDSADYGQAAIVDRDIDDASFQFITDGEIALL
ncbi:hypothetical protein D3C81_1752330 [compost metagenome]